MQFSLIVVKILSVNLKSVNISCIFFKLKVFLESQRERTAPIKHFSPVLIPIPELTLICSLRLPETRVSIKLKYM